MRLTDSHIALAIFAGAFFFGGIASAQTPLKDTHPELAPPKPLEADLSTPYIQQNQIVERVRSSGMDTEAWELLEDPETPNALRAAVVDAAARSQRAKRMPEIYVRRLKRFGNSTLTLYSLNCEAISDTAQLQFINTSRVNQGDGGGACSRLLDQQIVCQCGDTSNTQCACD